MKKILFLMMFLCGMLVHAQGDFRLGVNLGIPVGDAGDFSSFNIGADATYLATAGEVLSLGGMVGLSHYFGKTYDIPGLGEVEGEDITFLPIAAAGRIGLGDTFYLGADLGYALGLKDGVDGGFYYRPKIGFNLIGLNLNVSYSGISVDGGSFNTLNAGVEFGL